MLTDTETLALLLLTLLLIVAWTRIRSKELERETKWKLCMTVHRVALRHGITLPEGLSLAEAGAYVEQMVEAGQGSKSPSEITRLTAWRRPVVRPPAERRFRPALRFRPLQTTDPEL